MTARARRGEAGAALLLPLFLVLLRHKRHPLNRHPEALALLGEPRRATAVAVTRVGWQVTMPLSRFSAARQGPTRRHSRAPQHPSFVPAFAFTLVLAVVLALVLAILAWSSHAAHAQDTKAEDSKAQDWPTRPVRIIVPYGPGGIADLLVRMTTDRLAKIFGQPFVLENRPGGGGVVGIEYAAHSPNDGYTLAQAGGNQFSVVPLLQKLNYDPLKDLTPISIIAVNGMALAVNVD